jgi:hypothetical protein
MKGLIKRLATEKCPLEPLTPKPSRNDYDED